MVNSIGIGISPGFINSPSGGGEVTYTFNFLMVGGGAGGGGGALNSTGGGGGGAGAAFDSTSGDIPVGTVLNITIGAGSAGGPNSYADVNTANGGNTVITNIVDGSTGYTILGLSLIHI